MLNRENVDLLKAVVEGREEPTAPGLAGAFGEAFAEANARRRTDARELLVGMVQSVLDSSAASSKLAAASVVSAEKAFAAAGERVRVLEIATELFNAGTNPFPLLVLTGHCSLPALGDREEQDRLYYGPLDIERPDARVAA